MSGKSAKKPIERHVRIFLDDEPIEALTEARDALGDAENEATARLNRQIDLLKAVQGSPADVRAVETDLARERDEYLAPYREAVAAAEQAVRDASQVYVFRSLGRHAFDALLADHPPTEDDHKAVRKELGDDTATARFCAETFTPALIKASCIDPKLSDGQVREIVEDWNEAEVAELWQAALLVNSGRRVADLKGHG